MFYRRFVCHVHIITAYYYNIFVTLCHYTHLPYDDQINLKKQLVSILVTNTFT